VRLIHRNTRRNSLTADGQRLFEEVRTSLAEITAAMKRVKQAATDHAGVVRVSARTVFGRKVLLPLVTAFRTEHPAIDFDLLLEDRDVDLVDSRVDVSFFEGPPPARQVIARKLFSIQEVVCASPEYLQAHPTPRVPADLMGHQCTAYRQPDAGRTSPWEFHGKTGRVRYTVPVVLCCSDPEAELHAVLSGVGIGRMDSITVTASLRSGRLVPLLTDWVSDPIALYLCYGQRADMPARVRLFIDFAVATLQDSWTFSISRDELATLSQAQFGSLPSSS